MRKNAPPTGETFFGGGGWIRTTEANRNRFTVCPLWPLGNPSKITLTVKNNIITEGKNQGEIVYFCSIFTTSNKSLHILCRDLLFPCHQHCRTNCRHFYYKDSVLYFIVHGSCIIPFFISEHSSAHILGIRHANQPYRYRIRHRLMAGVYYDNALALSAFLIAAAETSVRNHPLFRSQLPE